MIRPLRSILSIAIGVTVLVATTAAFADLPAGYTGKPFDPAVNGGPKIPAKAKAGPYPIPGRLDFVNYDVGGEGITYHAGDHLIKPGDGYRTDRPTASLSLTTSCIPTGNMACQNLWYDTSATLDGTVYPSATDADFSIAAVQNGDWFDLTVNVMTSGTYTLSSTWATGNGPPGGEGGDGTMGLTVFSNGVKLGAWTAIFPNFNTYADFHHWKAYPNMMTVTLTTGLQVIKMESNAKHLQLDFVQFDLVGADGGVSGGDASASTDAGATGAGGGGGAAGATGAAGDGAGGAMTGTAGTSGAAGAGAAGAGAAGTGSGAGGTSSTGSAGNGAGGATSGGGGATGQVPKASSGCACATAERGTRGWPTGVGLALLGCALLLRRRSRDR